MGVTPGPSGKPAANGAATLGAVWLIGLAIFVSPFVLVNNAAGLGYGIALAIAWTIGVIAFWVKVGRPAAREEARWESLQKARKEGKA